jgi:general secretion pathway protein G
VTYNSDGGKGTRGTIAVSEPTISSLQTAATIAVTAIAVLGYLIARARAGRSDFSMIDALIIAAVITILGASGIPLVESVNQRAKLSALEQNLHALRSQIELYKAEHDGRPPVVYEGTFPQLIRATDADGIPGDPSKKFPYGPYLQTGIPVNPFTGRSVVTVTPTFPPPCPSGNGGWLYHEETGQITADTEGLLDR